MENKPTGDSLFGSTKLRHGDGTPPLVSVLMPVYSPDPVLLKIAIESVLGQNYDNLELVIVEDPSPAAGAGVIGGFSDSRIRYLLNSERTSFAGQLNKGIGLSRGAYVARLDADDIAEPDRLKRQVEFMEGHPEASVVGSAITIIDGEGQKLGIRRYPRNPDDVALRMRTGCAVAHPAVMFRKSDVIEVGGYHPEFGTVADYDLWCRMVLSGKLFFNMDDPLVRYRVHDQASKVTSLKKSLAATIEIKSRHFKGRAGFWGFRESARLIMEKCLMLLPPALVLRLFMAVTLEKRL